MPTEYNKDRGKWGYRFSLHGKRWKRYVWDTELEARNAEAAKRTELLENPPLPTDSIGNVAALYLIDSAEKGRSKWHLEHMRYDLNAFILPFFKSETPMSAITEAHIENFIKHHKKRKVKNSTIWHYVKTIRALFYWSMEKGHRFVRVNPVVDADQELIRRRRVVKPPLNVKNFERAFAVLDQYERAWWRTKECLGLRMDEGNRLLRTDPDFETGLIHIPGTKTEESECWLPMSPALQSELKAYLASRTDNSPYLFPGRSAQTTGKKIYSRRRLFEKIQRLTSSCADCGGSKIAKRRHCQDCKRIEQISRIHRCSKCKSGNAQEGVGCWACGSSNINPGVKLKPKDMRDYFATQVSAQVTDPTVIKNLMRHTSLNTTGRYTRTVIERMKEAVENLGANVGGQSGGHSLREKTQNDIAQQIGNAILSINNVKGKDGGRSRNRTYDLAHVRRAL